ncbi:MAG: hypothetical protein V7698_18540 [Paracoccaceae bacterium]
MRPRSDLETPPTRPATGDHKPGPRRGIIRLQEGLVLALLGVMMACAWAITLTG